MKGITLFLILVPLVCSQGSSDSDEDNYELKETADLVPPFPYVLKIQKDDLKKDIQELRNKIKNKANENLIHVMEVAESIKDKISYWIQNIKNHAEDITQAMKERLKTLEDNIKETIENMKVTSQNVKTCLEKEQLVIKDIIKQTLIKITKCLASNSTKLASLTENQFKLSIKDESIAFINEVEHKLNACEQDPENTKDCLKNVSDEVHMDLDEAEENILKNWSESRSIADNILQALHSCAITSVVDAATLIAQEVVQILKCVKENNIL